MIDVIEIPSPSDSPSNLTNRSNQGVSGILKPNKIGNIKITPKCCLFKK